MVISKLPGLGAKLLKYDRQAWDKLYFGIRKDISKGIRHGSAIGAGIGSFINDSSNPFTEDAEIPIQRSRSKTYKFCKKYRRFSKPRCRCRNKYNSYTRSNR